MRKTTIKSRIYEYGKYYVTVTETKTTFNAWLTLKNYGISSYMFGWLKNQPTGETYTLPEFLELVENNIDDYIMSYRENMESWENL